MVPALIQEVEDEVIAPTHLQLEPVESTLRNLLLDVAQYIDKSPVREDLETQVKLPEQLARSNLIIRFTGGWVRDKLLGVKSHDIDVAINKMTGYHFGLRMKEYLEVPGNLEKYGLESMAANEKQNQKAGVTDKSKTVGGLHKIEANPEKSKHLETTTLRILGLDIDLVNLRKETYTDDSRNPQIEFGTPEEDALRRDATANAMFYNINTGEVEDFTGYGYQDLTDKLLRTPLEPYQTFKDDPLRVLRLIRFASRLGWSVQPEALAAMRDIDIKDALRRKISRERIGTEVEKMLRGPDPHEALRLIFDLDVYETIFTDPNEEASTHFTPDVEGWAITIDALKQISASSGILADTLMRDEEEQYLAWQLVAMAPYRDAPLAETSESGRRPPPPTAVMVAKEGIKAPNKICDVVNSAVRNQSEISSLVDKLCDKKRRPEKNLEGEDGVARDVLGMAIRRWGPSWRSQVMYSMFVEIANNRDHVEPIERKYAGFIEHLMKLDILNAVALKPLMDGKVLAKALGTPPGPWMKDALDVVMAWQLRNPGVNDTQEAIAAVKNHLANGELTSALVRHFLKLTIRPLFIKASPSSVTAQGRKITTPVLPKKMTVESMDDSVNKPWKSAKDAHVLDLLRWTVQSLDETILTEVWPMVIPPLLTLVDDWETRYKRLGVELLNDLLRKTPPPLLERTGLGDVFEDALMPSLTYLPTITEVDDSVALLSAVYPALVTLAQVRYPPISQVDTKAQAPQLERSRVKFHDTVLRKGIIYGYSHCSNYPKIVKVLFDHLVPILDQLGIESVKHIKYILPMLTETMSHPLATASLPMLESATAALHALIRNCWPRMAVHRGEVLKCVTLCWLQVLDSRRSHEDGPIEDQKLEAMLRDTVQMLRAAVGSDTDFAADRATLLAADVRLQDLFETP